MSSPLLLGRGIAADIFLIIDQSHTKKFFFEGSFCKMLSSWNLLTYLFYTKKSIVLENADEDIVDKAL